MCRFGGSRARLGWQLPYPDSEEDRLIELFRTSYLEGNTIRQWKTDVRMFARSRIRRNDGSEHLKLIQSRWMEMGGHLHGMLHQTSHKYMLYNHIHTDWVVRFFVLCMKNRRYRHQFIRHQLLKALCMEFPLEYAQAQSEYPPVVVVE